ncbi:MAG: cyclic peptide export ABC transporter [Candidatus Hatepunaea meridiana]|nr:cyclic peptide export ABC transporter [Candidatus Hatepunaea meridiana]
MIEQIRLLHMYRQESKDENEGLKLLGYTFISAISNTLLLVIINTAAHNVEYKVLNIQYFIMFAACMAAFIVTQRHVLKQAVIISENIINRIRIRIGDKVRKCNFYELEKLGHTEIYSKLTKDAVVVTQSAPLIISATQCIIMVVLSMIYVAFLSKIAFVIALGVIILSILYYLKNDKIVSKNMRKAMEREVDLFGTLSHILDGFKEIKMNKKKSDEVIEDLRLDSDDVKNLKIKGLVPYADNYIFSIAFFFALIAIIIFVLPNLSTSFNDVVVKLTTAIIFIVGPISNVVNIFTVLAQSNIAIDNIYGLEKALDEHKDIINDNKQIVIPDAKDYNLINIDDMYFEYTDKEGNPVFSVGPINLKIKRNEIIYVVGGNGSGKTTFLKLLTALYYPKYGSISLDKVSLSKENIQSYRELYSIILSEFHLFNKLYGLSQIDEKHVFELLKLMEIENKTGYVDGRFTNLDLSTGQRKRLALVVTYLEDKEIYVFDEWAADQDPYFRKYFYEELIPDLKKRGKTVIAVTHDDRYYDSCDRVLKMDFGKMTTYLDNNNEKIL